MTSQMMIKAALIASWDVTSPTSVEFSAWRKKEDAAAAKEAEKKAQKAVDSEEQNQQN